MSKKKIIMSVGVNNFWNNNYFKYESNGDKNKNLPLDEYLNKIETYLRNIIINLRNYFRIIILSNYFHEYF